MTRAELDTAIGWAGDEGWNPGLADADCFHGSDPGGFLMAFQDGRPVASISVVAYGADFGFLGFYICHRDVRGRGIGYRLWQAGLTRLGARCIGLDGVVEQQSNYQKEGFVLAHRNIRYGGTVACEAPEDPRLRRITADQLAAILAYDRPFFPGPRAAFLRCWLQARENRMGFALVDQGAVAGYGVLRRCREGYKIGPLFADTPQDADLLFRALVARTRGAKVFLDPPAPNREANALAERYGLQPVFETARMYRGAAPDLPLQCIFGITTFELG
ncbi:GNAT family N-acetyltransferase [Pelagibius litoralis]|uniref:GNAT family N-acetyltransferase n=2 Tax=Pelagibius litoralis TaxID=374515 RepID=A0A967C4W3_9PROT|nr:GNAT family N-acetyltransferase [Pelagibius litoralis]